MLAIGIIIVKYLHGLRITRYRSYVFLMGHQWYVVAGGLLCGDPRQLIGAIVRSSTHKKQNSLNHNGVAFNNCLKLQLYEVVSTMHWLLMINYTFVHCFRIIMTKISYS